LEELTYLNKPFFSKNLIHQIMRPYTGNGDNGHSSTAKINAIPKNHEIFELLGNLDALNAQIGVARTLVVNETKTIDQILYKLQNELFDIGAAINLEDSSFPIKKALQEMESTVLELHEPLPELRNFILPGGTAMAASLHICRTKSREVERLFTAFYLQKDTFDELYLANFLKYLNRLSSLFFTLARYANFCVSVDDVIWQPRAIK